MHFTVHSSCAERKSMHANVNNKSTEYSIALLQYDYTLYYTKWPGYSLNLNAILHSVKPALLHCQHDHKTFNSLNTHLYMSLRVQMFIFCFPKISWSDQLADTMKTASLLYTSVRTHIYLRKKQNIDNRREKVFTHAKVKNEWKNFYIVKFHDMQHIHASSKVFDNMMTYKLVVHGKLWPSYISYSRCSIFLHFIILIYEYVFLLLCIISNETSAGYCCMKKSTYTFALRIIEFVKLVCKMILVVGFRMVSGQKLCIIQMWVYAVLNSKRQVIIIYIT